MTERDTEAGPDTGPGSGSGSRRTVPGIPSFTPHDQGSGQTPKWTPPPGVPTDQLDGSMLLDRYRIVEKIGEGGMGTVYRAEHVAIGKPVAIKMLRPEYSERPDLAERFMREARAAPSIAHDNIVDITDFGVTPDGRMFFAMEYLEGEDLADLIDREGAQPWARVRRIALQICHAMAAAHDKGVIHRDMKPANVFRTTKTGNRDFVKIVDFGIAKIVGEDGEHGKGVTQTGTVLGSIEYISPEQARGETPDKRADVYAVGVLMYELLTGRLPFKGNNRLATLNAVMFEAPLDLRAANPDITVPRAVEELVLRTMSKEPDTRPQSMRELAARIEELDPAELVETPDRSGVAGWAILAVGLLLIGGGLGAFLYLRPPGEADAATDPDAAAAAPDAGATTGAPAPEPEPEPEPRTTAPPVDDEAGTPPEPEPTPTPTPAPTKKKKHTSLNAKKVEKRVNKLLPKVRTCGEQAGSAIGTVIPVDMEISGETGRPTRIDLGEHANTPLGTCVQGLLEKLQFEPFSDPTANFKFKYRI